MKALETEVFLFVSIKSPLREPFVIELSERARVITANIDFNPWNSTAVAVEERGDPLWISDGEIIDGVNMT